MREGESIGRNWSQDLDIVFGNRAGLGGRGDRGQEEKNAGSNLHQRRGGRIQKWRGLTDRQQNRPALGLSATTQKKKGHGKNEGQKLHLCTGKEGLGVVFKELAGRWGPLCGLIKKKKLEEKREIHRPKREGLVLSQSEEKEGVRGALLIVI